MKVIIQIVSMKIYDKYYARVLYSTGALHKIIAFIWTQK